MADELKRALALYKGPFKHMHGYVFDVNGEMVCDDGDAEDRIARVRGWGRIQKKENPEQLQDSVGDVIALALSEFWERHNQTD